MLLCSIGFPEVPMFLQILGTRYSLLNADPKSAEDILAFDHQLPNSQFIRLHPADIRPTAHREGQSTSPVHLRPGDVTGLGLA
ncbi:hypothetical protein PtB15_1B56 [Puccinia triticina]|nr:hypothetical protein PtB15_1B56 [Puccinia triticina]